jgi:two-component system sensor histidine kinase YesM
MKFLNPLKRGNSHSIASRHLTFFLLFITLPVLLILILFGFFFRHEIVKTTRNQREITLRQYAFGINLELKGISIIASSLIHNTALMDRSKAFIDAKTPEQRYLISSELEKIFNTYSILSRQLIGFYVIFQGEDTPFVSRNYAGITLSEDEIDAYTVMAEDNHGIVSFPDNMSFSYGQESGWYITSLVVSPPRRAASATGLRTLIVPFVINPLMDFIRQKSVEGKSSNGASDYFLIGRNGNVLASSDTTAIGSGISVIESAYKGSYIFIKTPVESSSWTLAEAINIRSLTRPVNTILYILYSAVIIIVLFFVRYNTFFFDRILNPLKVLISKMETVGNGDFSVRAESGSFIELNKISESFNYMVEKISQLTEAIKKEQAERIRMEIEALRYQLNPHFLCNALNAIRMMAIITKNDAIRKMSSALMMITEDTLAREDTVYSLEHELYILDNYVYIMKVRYGDTFELIRDVDNSLLNIGLPSMILQPLVENAILHGFHGLSRPGIIVVSAAVTGEGDNKTLLVSVRDNGSGMPEETLADVFNHHKAGSQGFSRIGLYNVRRNIILSYGSAYGAEAVSYPGEGTVVTLRLPVQETERHESRFMNRKG